MNSHIRLRKARQNKMRHPECGTQRNATSLIAKITAVVLHKQPVLFYDLSNKTTITFTLFNDTWLLQPLNSTQLLQSCSYKSPAWRTCFTRYHTKLCSMISIKCPTWYVGIWPQSSMRTRRKLAWHVPLQCHSAWNVDNLGPQHSARNVIILVCDIPLGM